MTHAVFKKIFSPAGASICALIALSAVFFALVRSVRSAADLRAGLASRINDFADERVLGQSSAALLSSRRADMERIRGFFVNRSQPVAFVEELERIAAAVGASVAFEVDEDHSGPADLLFRLTAEGRQESVLRYLTLLEDAPYLMRMEEVTFLKSAGAGADARAPVASGVSVPEARATVQMRVQAL